jgi:hypothetical protein
MPVVPVIVRVHMSTEMKLSFVAKQNERGAVSSSFTLLSVPVHNILSCRTICVVQVANYSCFIWMQIQPFFFLCSVCSGDTCPFGVREEPALFFLSDTAVVLFF